jgi:hypothetical protein
MSTDQEQVPAVPTSVEERLADLEARCIELERKSVQSGRGLFLSVIAIYAVFVALLILHWAGHVMRHAP